MLICGDPKCPRVIEGTAEKTPSECRVEVLDEQAGHRAVLQVPVMSLRRPSSRAKSLSLGLHVVPDRGKHELG